MAEYFNADEIYDLSGDLLPCEFCHQLFPMDVLIAHSTGCRPDLTNYRQEKDTFKPLVDEAKMSLDIRTTPKTQAFRVPVKVPVVQTPKVSSEKIYSKINQQEFLNNENEDDDIQAIIDAVKASRKNAPKTLTVNETYNLETKKGVSESGLPNKTKSQQKVVLNNSVKFDSNVASGIELSNTIKNTFDESTAEDDKTTLSSDDDDAVESIENFWKRAATVLKKRLTESFPSKPSSSYRQPEIQDKMAMQRNRSNVYPKPRNPNQWRMT